MSAGMTPGRAKTLRSVVLIDDEPMFGVPVDLEQIGANREAAPMSVPAPNLEPTHDHHQ